MINYSEYLKSNYWRYRRQLFYKRHISVCCFNCGRYNTSLDVHHLRYYDEKGISILYKEKDEDLVLLCRNCHILRHKKKDNLSNVKIMNIRINWFVVLLVGILIGYLIH